MGGPPCAGGIKMADAAPTNMAGITPTAWARRAAGGIEPEVERWGVGARVVRRSTQRYDAEGKATALENEWSDVPVPFDFVAAVALPNGSTIEVFVGVGVARDAPCGTARVYVNRGERARVAALNADDRTSARGERVLEVGSRGLDLAAILCLRAGLAMVHMRCISFNAGTWRGTFQTGHRWFGENAADVTFFGEVGRKFCIVKEVNKRRGVSEQYETLYYEPAGEYTTASAFLEWARKATTIAYAAAEAPSPASTLERIANTFFGSR